MEELEVTHAEVPEGTTLSLAQSHIYVLEDRLVKHDEQGNLVASFPLVDIEDIRAAKRISPMALLVTVVGLALIYIGYAVIDSSVWSWAAYIPGTLLVLLSITAFTTTCLFST